MGCPTEEYMQEAVCVVQGTVGLEHSAHVSHACCMLNGDSYVQEFATWTGVHVDWNGQL